MVDQNEKHKPFICCLLKRTAHYADYPVCGKTPQDALQRWYNRHAFKSELQGTSYALKSRGCLTSLAKGSDGGVGRVNPNGRFFWTSVAAVLAVAVLVAKPKPELLGATVLVVCPDELSPL